MSDRIPCINPRCRRTAPADKYEPGVQIVCGKCWRKMPKRITEAYRRLERKRKKLERLYLKRGRDPRTPTLDRLQHENWKSIWRYFNAPERPEGLDRFLEEMGMAS